MKILMTTSWQAPEYLYDGVLHGFRELIGEDLIEYPRAWYMYDNSIRKKSYDLNKIVGKGFTLYGLLNDAEVDRTDLAKKIRKQYFDYIIMHPWYPSSLAHVIYENTPKNKLIWLDGRDESQILDPYVGFGTYFKRELVSPRSNILPISFAIPKCKIQQPVEKTRAIAHCIPGHLETYIYDTELDYYNGYNESLFAITTKKQGWDCMRHYEILASRSIPYFVDLRHCPESICTSLPKNFLLKVNKLLGQYNPDDFMHGMLRDEYENLREQIYSQFEEKCTTDSLAKYILDNV